ncbi:hypothetical protein [Rufibacter ruber]|uniref:hypothetical protein n=1 Tax=Rufibacter ruber TaxID=1783499 RepID=UPI00082D1F8A|nr:hypothetical protein [Rufibacter ruber]
MNQRLTAVAQYLSYSEAIGLYQALKEAGVVALVKSSGPPSLPFGEGLYFQLLIAAENLPAAQTVLDLFSEKQAGNSHRAQTCPRCGSVQVLPSRNLSWWKKVLYAGTTVYGCAGCNHSFFA